MTFAHRIALLSFAGTLLMPLAAHATLDAAGILTIQAAWGDPDQPAPLVHASAQAVVADNTQAAALGEQVAAQLRQGGAR